MAFPFAPELSLDTVDSQNKTLEEYLSYLKTSREPYQLQQEAWNFTRKSRRQFLVQYSKENTPYNYVQQFLGLQNDDGYKLVRNSIHWTYKIKTCDKSNFFLAAERRFSIIVSG